MASRKQPDAGQRQEMTFRYGPEVPVKGMRRRGDPGTIQLPYWAYLQNVRFNDGITGRPGADKMLDNLDDEIISIYDFQPNGLKGKLYVLTEGSPACGLSTVGQGASLSWIDWDKQDRFTGGVYWDDVTLDRTNSRMAFHDGVLYLSRKDTLSAFIPIEPDYEEQSIFLAGVDQSETLKVFTGFTIRCMTSAFGELFIGLDNGAGASKIVRYDGLTFRDDDLAVDPPTVMRVFRNNLLVVGYSTGGLRVRNTAGAWTAIAGAVVPTQMDEYRDNLYMTEGDTPDIWKFDGAAVAIDHTIVGTEIDGIANALGYLYFGYKSATAKAILGRLDSTLTYTDVHHNFSTFDTTFDWAEKVNLISFYRGGLVLGFSTTMILIVTKSAVGYSEGTDTAGAYTAIQPTLSTRFHLIQFGTF